MKQTTWEYTTSPAYPDKLNELGAKGWEVIGAAGESGELMLKRPALDFREQVTLDQRRRYFGYWGLDVPEDEA